jgi:hypothetical protein
VNQDFASNKAAKNAATLEELAISTSTALIVPANQQLSLPTAL